MFWYIIAFAAAGGYLSGGKGIVIGIVLGLILGFIYSRIDEALRSITRLQESVDKLQSKVKTINRIIHQPEQTQKVQPNKGRGGNERPEEKPTVGQPEKIIFSPPLAVATMQDTESVRNSNAADFFVNLGSQLYKAGTVVQTGIVLLLFGLVFLVRYAAVNQRFTVEAGLVATMVVGMILLIIGWRLIRKKRAYALMLQGGSVAILFTCLFLSTEVYSLFPVFVSFATMICLSVLAGLLAVQYDTRETALIGMGGGFAAPLLSPVTSEQLTFLFLYYLILVVGIFAVSRLRSWRVLQLLSCIFIIFVAVFIGRTEEITQARAQLEPFLLLFFLFYSMTEIMTAQKREAAWGDGMDLTLTLGPPLACIAFQAALSYPAAMQLFSITLALLTVYYAATAYCLQRFAAERLALLVQTCIYLAFFCGNLLIFYETSFLVTTLVYNAEAVCWVWIATRKKQKFTFWLGFILLPLAFLPLTVAYYEDAQLIFQSNPFLILPVGLSFFLAPFLCALLGAQAKESLQLLDKKIVNGLLLWSLCVWLAGGASAVVKTMPIEWAPGLLLLLISFSFGFLRFLAQRLSWKFPDQICDGYGILLSVFAIAHLRYAVKYPENISLIFLCSSSLSWIISLSTHYALLFIDTLQTGPFFRTLNHRLGIWLIGFLLIVQMYSAVIFYLHPGPVWLSSFFGMFTGCWILTLLLFGQKLRWPVRRYPLDYQGYGVLPFALFVWGWTLNACLSLGDPAPLIYIPLLNPLELAQGTCLAALFVWARALKRPALQAVPLPSVVKNNMGIALYGTLALCLTLMIARTVCYYTDIAFSADGILFSSFFQTIISIIWSAVAFFIMLISVRSNQQRVNALGTMLLFLVAAKLFLVDIHLSREIERICSFMWVGGIMLLAGYFIPADEGEPVSE